MVVNHEKQYSIIPADQPLKRGWRDTGRLGSDAGCLKHIKEVWTDIRSTDIERIKASLRS
jgi:MbtH protein